jgi:hypothetical protein
MPEDDDDAQITQYRNAYTNAGGSTAGWRAVVRLADLARDKREAVIVGRVEHYLEQLIEDTGEENPSLTVRDVRARLFEIPQ